MTAATHAVRNRNSMPDHQPDPQAAPFRGLQEAEAGRRLQSFGPNELPAPPKRGLRRILAETLREPMFLLLLAAAVIYLVLGSLGEGLFLLVGACGSIGLVVAQEARSERALAALRELAQPLARVLRDGEERQVAARTLVPGDVLLVGEGERLPADARLVGGEVLSVDESLLTGESATVAKLPGEGSLFSGTIVVRGQGVAEVTLTGARSALGRIGASLANVAPEQTPLQQKAGRLIALLGGMALLFCAIVAIAYGLLRDDWVAGALAGITVAIALIPEEFPMVLAVFMALGAWRLASHNVLTRRSASVETLGGITTLCADKTGTLTENRMIVGRLWVDGKDVPVAPEAAILDAARLASAVRPIDPMDKAVHAASGESLPGEPSRSWPLRPELLAVVQLWQREKGGYLAAAKGAPEAIFRLCRLDSETVARLEAVIEDYAREGLRVLGVASASVNGASGDAFGDDPEGTVFHFEGLMGFIDPLRADVPAALAEARRAGIDVIMITGDHPATAMAIARAAGLETDAGALLGSEIASLPLPELQERLRHVRVCARVVPEQKLRIIAALRASGRIVAMTGDGVNDAPALEAAHVGIAMGRKGTDVAREAADLVLLDDSFASIIGGVRLGRRIFANLRHALTYIVAIHVPIAGVALAPLLLGYPPLLFPMHVVLMELAIDPICALVFEAEPSDADVMKQKPRPASEPLFGPRQIWLGVLQGLVILAGVLGLYGWALAHHDPAVARGASFAALVLGNLVLALANSATTGPLFVRQRMVFWAIALAIVLLLTLVLMMPALAGIFAVAPLPMPLLLAAIAVGLVCGGWSALLLRKRS